MRADKTKLRRNTEDRYTIVVHGGTISKSDEVTDAQLDLIRAVVTDAHSDLASGATALDIVTNAIVVMENI